MIQKEGGIDSHVMYNTYNMGLGMILAVNEEDADKTVKAVTDAGEKAYIVGETVSGDKKEVELC